MADANERSRQKSYRDYETFRKAHPKVDIEFLSAESRRQRVCNTAEELSSFLARFLDIADEAKAGNRDCYMIVDTEGDFVIPGETKRKPQPFYWHKLQLRLEGYNEEHLAQREEKQSKIGAEYAALNRKAKQKRRGEYDRERREDGLIQSDVFAFQLACVQDDRNELTCVAHTVNIACTLADKIMPPELFRLFSHPSVVWLNVGIEEDLRAMNDSFFHGELRDARFLDVKTMAEQVYGNPLPKLDDVFGQGGLGLFQRVFRSEKLSWKKSPLLTHSHWWSPHWSNEQISYALMDVHSIALMVRSMLPNMPLSPGAMSSPFPRDHRQSNTANGSQKRSRNRVDSVTEPFEFAPSPDSEDDIFLRSSPAETAVKR